jgi:antibiotic biosynthesis monooxygenase (ABM) superfamily enzyme
LEGRALPNPLPWVDPISLRVHAFSHSLVGYSFIPLEKRKKLAQMGNNLLIVSWIFILTLLRNIFINPRYSTFSIRKNAYFCYLQSF